MNFNNFVEKRKGHFLRDRSAGISEYNFQDMNTRPVKGGLLPPAIFRGKTIRLDYILHLALNEPEILVELKRRFKEIK